MHERVIGLVLRGLPSSILALLLLSIHTGALAQQDLSIRIGTFNTFMKPDAWGPGANPYDWDMEKAAEALAQRIIASGYDVIALQEVFDEDAKQVLSEKLLTHYRHQVVDIDSGDLQDSGLFLASKFPFFPVPSSMRSHLNLTASTLDAEIVLNGIRHRHTAVLADPEVPDHLAFRMFDECGGTLKDCLAAKGIAYVRLVVGDGVFANVFFTHLNSSYLDDDDNYANVRYWQLVNDFKTMLSSGQQSTLNPIDPDGELIYLLGDLNIDGDLSNPDLIEPGAFEDRMEWVLYFSNSASALGGDLRNTLWDTWVFESPLQDVLPGNGAVTPGPFDGDEDMGITPAVVTTPPMARRALSTTLNGIAITWASPPTTTASPSNARRCGPRVRRRSTAKRVRAPTCSRRRRSETPPMVRSTGPTREDRSTALSRSRAAYSGGSSISRAAIWSVCPNRRLPRASRYRCTARAT